MIPVVPKHVYVYGSYDVNSQPQAKPRKERQKVIKEKFQKKEPEKVTSLNKDEESIEEIVKIQYEVLMEKYNANGQESIKYYDYIIDTDDFANTVENMFYFSFLIRDGRAKIDLSKFLNCFCNRFKYFAFVLEKIVKYFEDDKHFTIF